MWQEQLRQTLSEEFSTRRVEFENGGGAASWRGCRRYQFGQREFCYVVRSWRFVG